MEDAQVFVRECFTQLQTSKADWDQTNKEAQALVTEVVNLLLQLTYINKSVGGALSQMDGLHEIVHAKLWNRIAAAHTRLRAALDVLAEDYNAMKIATTQMKNRQDEICRVCGDDAAFVYPLYSTCPLHQFVIWGEEISLMYSKEIALKKALVEDLPECMNRDTLAIYASTWLMQPYINVSQYDLIVEAAKKEIK